MKLEIKHLTPYLPYNLQVEYRGEVTTLDALDSKGGAFVGKNRMVSFIDLKHIKPILRPLSSITDMDIYNIDSLIYDDVEIYSSLKDGLRVRADGNYGWCHTPSLGIDGINKISEYLFKNHFDVFGLIEKGLAVEKG